MTLTEAREPFWKRRREWVVALIVLTVAAVCTWSQLPRGICYSDSGGLQLAAATLGITHPPGYVVYTSFGFLASKVLPFDPAFSVTFCAWLMTLGAFALIAVFVKRWNASSWVAGAAALALLMHKNVRQNYLAPEVYGPTLCVMVAAVWLWAKYLRSNQLWVACVAALLFGIAWVSRPPTVLILPFLIVSFRMARGRFLPCGKKEWKCACAVVAMAIVPFVYSFGYLLTRDSPRAAYNYLDVYDAEHHELPSREAGIAERVERVYWHASATQFRESVHITFWGVVSKLRWVRNRLMPNQHALFALALLIAAIGVVRAWRSDRSLTLLVLGLAFSSLAFVCLYRVHDLAADLLPFVFAVGAFASVGLNVIVARLGERWSRWVAVGLFGAMVLATGAHNVIHREDFNAADALAFVSKADVENLPRDAVVMSEWYHAPPLWYAQHMNFERRDLKVLCFDRRRWGEVAAQFNGRTVFAVEEAVGDEPFESVKRGTLWEWRVKKSE